MKTLGISSNCLLDMPLFDALEILSKKTESIEIMSACDHSLPEFNEAAESFSVRYYLHSPTSDGNIADPFERIRKASLLALRESAEAADDIGAVTLVIHPGFCLEPELFHASSLALKKSIADLGKMQDEFSTRFVIENLGSLDYCHFRFPDLIATIRECGLGFCLDVGHAHLNSMLDSFLRESPDHMHLHDNHGVCDEHAACGTGTINFDDVMAVDSAGVVECMEFDAAMQSLEYLQAFMG